MYHCMIPVEQRTRFQYVCSMTEGRFSFCSTLRVERAWIIHIIVIVDISSNIVIFIIIILMYSFDNIKTLPKLVLLDPVTAWPCQTNHLWRQPSGSGQACIVTQRVTTVPPLGFVMDLVLTATSYAMASSITSVSIICSTGRWGAYQRKHQSSASLTFVRGIHQWSVNSPHKGPVTWKMFPYDHVIVIVNN